MSQFDFKLQTLQATIELASHTECKVLWCVWWRRKAWEEIHSKSWWQLPLLRLKKISLIRHLVIFLKKPQLYHNSPPLLLFEWNEMSFHSNNKSGDELWCSGHWILKFTCYSRLSDWWFLWPQKCFVIMASVLVL